jgi:hypothetical protein
MKWPSWGWKAVAALVGVLALWHYGCWSQQQGAVRFQIKTLEHERDSLKAERQKREIVYRTDTVHLTKVRVVNNRALDSLPPRAREFVGAERQACDRVITTCADQRAGLARENANLEAQLKLEKKRKPSRFGCAAPFAATTKGIGLGVSCGVRFP